MSDEIHNITSNSSPLPSIFSFIKNKPYQNEYGNRIFECHQSFNEITYPKENRDKQISFDQLPEYKSINEAIGECDKRSDKENKYILVSGDLSGIQDTVYTISSKGALKSLRARSFMLEFLCEHICYEIISNVLGKYKTFRNHVIFTGGGGFCLLLPNNNTAIEAVNTIKVIINDWAFEEFGGKLYVALTSEELNEDEVSIENDNSLFKEKWNSLSDRLEVEKKRKFNWKLNEIFSDAYVKEPTLRNNSQECQVCHRDDIDLKVEPLRSLNGDRITDIEMLEAAEANTDNPIIHEQCYQLLKLGDRLTKAKFISRIKARPGNENNGYLTFPSLKKETVYYEVEIVNAAECVWSINNFDTNVIPFYYANYVTKYEDLAEEIKEIEKSENSNVKRFHTASFNSLANCSRGASLISCLRMDVDDMGKVLTEDLTVFNLVTLANFSKMLNIFFKVYLPLICHAKLGTPIGQPTNITSKDYSNGRKVSIVYSGGDDLFIVGAWDETTELAYDIQRCFKEFSGLGISAGLTLHKPNFPLYQMAKQSAEALDNSKSEFDDKDRITLFYSRELKNLSYDIQNDIMDDLKSRGKLRSYSDEFVYHSLDMQEDMKRMHLSIKWDNYSTSCKNIVEQLWNDTNLITKGKFYQFFDLLENWYEEEGIYIPKLFWLINDFKNTSFEKTLLEMFNYSKIKSLHTPLTWYKYLRS